jgi:PAS domain-containing protein
MVGDGTTRNDLALNLAAPVESEALFRVTFENAAVGIAHVAVDGRFLRVNRRWSEITGYKRDESWPFASKTSRTPKIWPRTVSSCDA